MYIHPSIHFLFNYVYQLFRYNINKGFLRRKYFYKVAHFLDKVFCCGRCEVKRPVPERYFQISFFSFEPLYRILFTILSIVALVLGGYFYCGCMIYLFLRNTVLINVLKAVRKSGKTSSCIYIYVYYLYCCIVGRSLLSVYQTCQA